MSSGSASSMCWLLNCGSLYYINRSSLNILWIIHPSRCSSWNASWPMFFEILKGPYFFRLSFFEDLFEWIFLASNHTLYPAFNPCRFLFFLSNCLFITSFAISIDFIASSQLFCNPIRKSSRFGNSVCTTRFPFYKYLPKLSSNGVLPIAKCLLLLY